MLSLRLLFEKSVVVVHHEVPAEMMDWICFLTPKHVSPETSSLSKKQEKSEDE